MNITDSIQSTSDRYSVPKLACVFCFSVLHTCSIRQAHLVGRVVVLRPVRRPPHGPDEEPKMCQVLRASSGRTPLHRLLSVPHEALETPFRSFRQFFSSHTPARDKMIAFAHCSRLSEPDLSESSARASARSSRLSKRSLNSRASI